MGFIDVLVPAAPDPQDLLERLRKLGIRDGALRVDPGPLDEATINLARQVIGVLNRNLLLELPRGRQDLAVMLGVYLQLMRLGARMRQPLSAEVFAGPVVVVGLNTNLTERLRRIRIGTESLSEALCAQRVRADGTVTDLRGTISLARAWGDGLLYLNTSLGWPRLPGVQPGVVVIDRTSFRNPETLTQALAWCDAHGATRTVVLSTLGDPVPTTLRDTASYVRWAWTPGLRHGIRYELGAADCCGPLSTNPLLSVPPRRICSAIYVAPELSRLRRTCLSGIIAARSLKQPFPRAVADALRLTNLLGGTWGHVETANIWAAADPRAVSVAALARSVRNAHGDDLRGPWALFRETHWPDLRQAVLRLAELIAEYNPRLDVLMALLDWAAATHPSAPVIVRTDSRSAAGALIQDLIGDRPGLGERIGDGDPGIAPLAVLPYSDRLPWAAGPALELHLGVPAPWRRSAILSAEASEHIVLVDGDEQKWLQAVVADMQGECDAALNASAASLALGPLTMPHIRPPHLVFGPLEIDGRGTELEGAPAAAVPALDMARMFAAFSEAVAQVDRAEDDYQPENPGFADGQPTLARALTLEPGDTFYWLPADGRVEVLAGTKYSTVLVSHIQAGMSLLIPRGGESRDELYARLLAAAHCDADVMAVEFMLRRFRRAMDELHDRFGSWDKVARELRYRGSNVETGAACRLWATGEVIAPEDIVDIRRVGWLAYDDSLLADRIWERIGRIAEELRRLHRSLGRLLSAAIAEAVAGRSGENIRRLSELCGGIDIAEILEEFDVRQIRSVGAPTSVPRSQLRHLLAARLESSGRT